MSITHYPVQLGLFDWGKNLVHNVEHFAQRTTHHIIDQGKQAVQHKIVYPIQQKVEKANSSVQQKIKTVKQNIGNDIVKGKVLPNFCDKKSFILFADKEFKVMSKPLTDLDKQFPGSKNAFVEAHTKSLAAFDKYGVKGPSPKITSSYTADDVCYDIQRRFQANIPACKSRVGCCSNLVKHPQPDIKGIKRRTSGGWCPMVFDPREGYCKNETDKDKQNLCNFVRNDGKF